MSFIRLSSSIFPPSIVRSRSCILPQRSLKTQLGPSSQPSSFPPPPPSSPLASASPFGTNTFSLLLAGTIGAVLSAGALLVYSSSSPIALETPSSHECLPPPPSAIQPSLSVARAQRYGSPSNYKSALEELRLLFSEENDTLTIDPEDLFIHGGSSWNYLASQPPSVVVYPRDQSDVEKIMEISRKYRIPVVPYGAGTAVEGQFNAVSSSLSRSFKKKEAPRARARAHLRLSLRRLSSPTEESASTYRST